MYLTVTRHGESGNTRSGNSQVSIGSQPFTWQQVELPAAA
jgi:hypothetical protein